MRDYEEKSYYEIQLDNKQLILVFLAGVTVCVLIFILGVMVGKGKKEAEIASLAKAEPKTAAPEQPSKEPQDLKTAVETEPTQLVKDTKGKKGKATENQQPQTDQYSFYDLDKKDSKDDQLTPGKTPAKEAAKTAQNKTPAKPEATTAKNTKPEEITTTTATPAPATATEDTPAPAGGSRRYTVQVMATASKSKAEQQLSVLKAKGYSAFMDEEKSGSSSVFKIRVGKFGDPDSAKKTAVRLKQDLKLETWVAVLD
jgi:cell division protein FtsN